MKAELRMNLLQQLDQKLIFNLFVHLVQLDNFFKIAYTVPMLMLLNFCALLYLGSIAKHIVFFILHLFI